MSKRDLLRIVRLVDHGQPFCCEGVDAEGVPVGSVRPLDFRKAFGPAGTERYWSLPRSNGPRHPSIWRQPTRRGVG